MRILLPAGGVKGGLAMILGDHDGELAVRVRRTLATLGRFDHVRVTEYGKNVFIAGAASAARLSHIEGDLFGLAFRGAGGRWGSMFVIDTLDEIVAEMAAAIDLPPPSSDPCDLAAE